MTHQTSLPPKKKKKNLLASWNFQVTEFPLLFHGTVILSPILRIFSTFCWKNLSFVCQFRQMILNCFHLPSMSLSPCNLILIPLEYPPPNFCFCCFPSRNPVFCLEPLCPSCKGHYKETFLKLFSRISWFKDCFSALAGHLATVTVATCFLASGSCWVMHRFPWPILFCPLINI